jgi:hypothetical protein
MTDSRPFIRGKVAIESMRDNGFLSAAHALAELIDNSVQAKADLVELITFEKRITSGGGRNIKQIDKIGVLDNGSGMSREVLHLALEFGGSENRKNKGGIGKFGMGLPNSSISQCRKVEVWSWTSPEEMYYTKLDIDLMLSGELENIPYPTRHPLPHEFEGVLGEKMPSSGTFVLWSNIDRCQWKTGKSIFRHTQDLVGRMYRYFISDKKVSIRFKSCELDERLYIIKNEKEFKANDPLYLMKDTSLPGLPEPYDAESMFELVDEAEFEIPDEKGVPQTVKIIGTVVKSSVLKAISSTTGQTVGHTVWGKHAVKNIGLSVVRSGRELSLRDEFIPFDQKSSGTARWTGIEIQFSPALDKVFGVTNNKQHTVNLQLHDLADDAEREGFESEREYRRDLLYNKDPKLQIYEVLNHVNNMIELFKPRLKSLSYKGTINIGVVDPGAEVTVAPITIKANEKNNARNTVNPVEDDEPSAEELKQTLIEHGIGVDVVDSKVQQILENQLKVLVETTPMATDAFFDVTTKRGFTLLQINSSHVFFSQILEKVTQEQRDTLELCLAGWARMEQECVSARKLQQLQIARKDWGMILDDFLGDDLI